MKIHVLTAVTRLQNLPEIERSFARAWHAGVTVEWHRRYDPERQHVGGQALKNEMIDQIVDGWIWICDDDNSMLPDFCTTLARIVAESPGAAMIVCAQRMPGGGVRSVHPGMLRECSVDAAQVVVRRDAIGDIRLPERYTGDGAWIEQLAAVNAGRILFTNEPIVAYNRLRWAE